jgi:hypothetical protein
MGAQSRCVVMPFRGRRLVDENRLSLVREAVSRHGHSPLTGCVNLIKVFHLEVWHFLRHIQQAVLLQ